jgi:hypothetical protein
LREILAMDPDRIRHGIRAVDDPDLLAEIAGTAAWCWTCGPTSNVRHRGACPSLADHPLPALRAAGVRCTINTDDPAMFGTDLSVEHEVAAGLGCRRPTRSRPASPGALCDDVTRARSAEIGQAAFTSAPIRSPHKKDRPPRHCGGLATCWVSLPRGQPTARPRRALGLLADLAESGNADVQSLGEVLLR